MIFCYDTTDGSTFTEVVKLYKQLLTNPKDSSKLSRFAKVPVAFVGTKLDLTDFLKSDATAVPRCIKVADLRLWLEKVHRRADQACFETSAKENIGISMMVEWVVKAALRVYPEIEKAKTKHIDRFKNGQGTMQASIDNLREFLANTGNLPDD